MTIVVFIVSDGTNNLVVYRDASKKRLECILMQNGKVIAHDYEYNYGS